MISLYFDRIVKEEYEDYHDLIIGFDEDTHRVNSHYFLGFLDIYFQNHLFFAPITDPSLSVVLEFKQVKKTLFKI